MSFDIAIKPAKISFKVPRSVISEIARVICCYPEFVSSEAPLDRFFMQHYCDRVILKLKKKHESKSKDVRVSFEPAEMVAICYVYEDYKTKYGLNDHLVLLNTFIAVPYINQIP